MFRKRIASRPIKPGGSDDTRGAAPPLCLRLVSSRGRPRDEVLTVPASGNGMGMSAALELGGERLSEAQWRAANQCRIAWQAGREGSGGWQLSNASRTLACALNGKRVGGALALGIAPGDTLELGQLRFVVEVDVPVAAFDEVVGTPMPPVGAGSADGEVLDLRDLALPAHRVQTGILDDPFGVLEIRGAKARSPVDPLAGFPGEVSKGSSPDRPKPKSPAQPDRAGMERHSPADPATALLDGLNQEFERVVRDPMQLFGRSDWAGVVKPGGGRAATLDELVDRAARYPQLLDILQSRPRMGELIDEFDPLGRNVSLATESDGTDVLRLFAPEVPHLPPAVPSLTRREHHELSPDSHMQIGGAREVAD